MIYYDAVQRYTLTLYKRGQLLVSQPKGTSVRGNGRGRGWCRGMALGVSCEQSTSELRRLAEVAGVAQYGRKSVLHRRLQLAGVI